jgi:hypothetical protein
VVSQDDSTAGHFSYVYTSYVAGSCKCSNEPTGSIKCGQFLDCLAFQEGLSSMDLVKHNLLAGY